MARKTSKETMGIGMEIADRYAKNTIVLVENFHKDIPIESLKKVLNSMSIYLGAEIMKALDEYEDRHEKD